MLIGALTPQIYLFVFWYLPRNLLLSNLRGSKESLVEIDPSERLNTLRLTDVSE